MALKKNYYTIISNAVCSIINTLLFYAIFILFSFQNPQPFLSLQQAYYSNVFNKLVFSFYVFFKLGIFYMNTCILNFI